jgi:hypothetical protein
LKKRQNAECEMQNGHSAGSRNREKLNHKEPSAASRNQNEHGDDQRRMGKAGEKSGE